jgi:hypothetical protein
MTQLTQPTADTFAKFPPATLDLSIVIVSFNAWDYLEKCLLSIRNTVQEMSYEIIVVDNNSLDGTVGRIRSDFPGARLIANSSNVGFARGNNQGIEVARGRYVLLLNNDTEVLPGAVYTLFRIMENHPRVGLLGCRLLNTDGSLQVSFGSKISFISDFSRKYVINFYEIRKNRLVGRYLEWRHSRQREVDWVKGACMFLRRQALLDAEMLDEKIFMYTEEVDLGSRISDLGWKIWYTPEARIIHHGGISTSANSYRAQIEYRKSQLYFYSKHYGRNGELLIRAFLVAKMCRNILWWRWRDWISGEESELSRQRKLFCREVLSFARNFHYSS